MKSVLLVSLMLAGCSGTPPASHVESSVACGRLALRFNQELAGHFPFAGLDSPEASIKTVREFFRDYDATRASISAEGSPAFRSFLAQLDEVADLFRPNLPVRLDVAIQGSDQVVAWRLTSGASSAHHPNGPREMEWRFGEPLMVELIWAERSPWRPASSSSIPDLVAEGCVASFASSGEWALLRLIENHRPKGDPLTRWIDFKVPTAGASGEISEAHVVLALGFPGLKLPADFPRSAPRD